MFARLFESEKYGQMVAIKDESDQGTPEVHFIGETPNGVRISLNAGWNDDDSGWAKQKETIERITLEEMEGILGGLYGAFK